jgi:serine/threonine-protein kinase RsbW
MAISLQIQSRLDQVCLIRASVTGILEHLRVVEADILALELAVAEVVNNSVEHGYAGAENEQIRVYLEVTGTSVRIEVIDHAMPFPEELRYRLLEEPSVLEDPDEEWSSRGHGIQIVRQIVDSIAITRAEAQNRLTLNKTVTLRQV